eukprot:2251110-Rhodomonas_salina.1
MRYRTGNGSTTCGTETSMVACSAVLSRIWWYDARQRIHKLEPEDEEALRLSGTTPYEMSGTSIACLPLPPYDMPGTGIASDVRYWRNLCCYLTTTSDTGVACSATSLCACYAM